MISHDANSERLNYPPIVLEGSIRSSYVAKNTFVHEMRLTRLRIGLVFALLRLA